MTNLLSEEDLKNPINYISFALPKQFSNDYETIFVDKYFGDRRLQRLEQMFNCWINKSSYVFDKFCSRDLYIIVEIFFFEEIDPRFCLKLLLEDFERIRQYGECQSYIIPYFLRINKLAFQAYDGDYAKFKIRNLKVFQKLIFSNNIFEDDRIHDAKDILSFILNALDLKDDINDDLLNCLNDIEQSSKTIMITENFEELFKSELLEKVCRLLYDDSKKFNVLISEMLKRFSLKSQHLINELRSLYLNRHKQQGSHIKYFNNNEWWTCLEDECLEIIKWDCANNTDNIITCFNEALTLVRDKSKSGKTNLEAIKVYLLENNEAANEICENDLEIFIGTLIGPGGAKYLNNFNTFINTQLNSSAKLLSSKINTEVQTLEDISDFSSMFGLEELKSVKQTTSYKSIKMSKINPKKITKRFQSVIKKRIEMELYANEMRDHIHKNDDSTEHTFSKSLPNQPNSKYKSKNIKFKTKSDEINKSSLSNKQLTSGDEFDETDATNRNVNSVEMFNETFDSSTDIEEEKTNLTGLVSNKIKYHNLRTKSISFQRLEFNNSMVIVCSDIDENSVEDPFFKDIPDTAAEMKDASTTMNIPVGFKSQKKMRNYTTPFKNRNKLKLINEFEGLDLEPKFIKKFRRDNISLQENTEYEITHKNYDLCFKTLMKPKKLITQENLLKIKRALRRQFLILLLIILILILLTFR